MYTPTNPESTTYKVLAIIREDPGVNRSHILARLDNGITPQQISNSLRFLRRTNRIQNLGKHAKGASWYPAN